MHQLEIIPEIGKSRNSVQVHQFPQKLAFVAPTSVPHAQDQGGSRVAESIKESVSQ